MSVICSIGKSTVYVFTCMSMIYSIGESTVYIFAYMSDLLQYWDVCYTCIYIYEYNIQQHLKSLLIHETNNKIFIEYKDIHKNGIYPMNI